MIVKPILTNSHAKILAVYGEVGYNGILIGEKKKKREDMFERKYTLIIK